jgi:hypothetical protein
LLWPLKRVLEVQKRKERIVNAKVYGEYEIGKSKEENYGKEEGLKEKMKRDGKGRVEK